MKLRTAFRKARIALALLVPATFGAPPAFAEPKEVLFPHPINTTVPHIRTDPSVRYDYDIVYVRAPRAGDEKHKRFYTDFSQPVTMEPGADLMLLHPDGTEELLVAGGEGSITDPVVSFDGQWVYYSHLYDLQKREPVVAAAAGRRHFQDPRQDAAHRASSRIRRSRRTPARPWSDDFRTPRKGRTHLRLRRVQHGAVSAARRADRVHEQSRRLSCRRKVIPPSRCSSS